MSIPQTCMMMKIQYRKKTRAQSNPIGRCELQINSMLKTNEKSVSAELTILANVTDNQAIYKCEAHNSATQIPLFETKTLSVHCK